MKNAMQQSADKLNHALVFVRLAKETKFSELRQQHLDEAERLIEGVLGIVKDHNGQAK